MVFSKTRLLRSAAILAGFVVLPGLAHAADDGLLFRLSGDKGLTADFAKGVAEPNIAAQVSIEKDPVRGAYIQAQGTQALSWMAPGNIYSQRGTLSFYWKARDPLGRTEFPIFRVAYADHTSWDMVWLRIDWNGHGFDAFVTDNNLSRVRVSVKLDQVPPPDKWTLITFTWDETKGIVLYLDGKKVASQTTKAVLDAGLDQFGPHSRVISPHQVQSNYPFIRGGDIDEIRIYDHAISDTDAQSLADGKDLSTRAPERALTVSDWGPAWAHRYGFDNLKAPPIYLGADKTRIRKVEFADQFDLKERITLGSDGMDETTWPGVYNRSRLAGRHDYFELPDWNVYVEGGKSLTLDLPPEPFNHIELIGAGYGKLSYSGTDGKPEVLATRPQGAQRTAYDFASRSGGTLRFDNVAQETPIQEIAAYNLTNAPEPNELTLSYKVTTGIDINDYPALDTLKAFVAGRNPADERQIVAALPAGAPNRPAPASASGASASPLPIVQILIPEDFRVARPGRPYSAYEYGWEGMNGGLDGIAIDIPALKVKPTNGDLFPLNIKIKDPLWPGRDLLNVDVSVKPGEARTVFLDTRDRILPTGKSLYISIAGSGADFDASQLNGMPIRLKFKPYADALPEHITDRLAQARDNYAFLIEERTASKRLARFERLNLELSDLLRVDPQNQHGREMWAEIYPEQGNLPVTMPKVPDGVPAWAFLQTQDLKRVRTFIDWWIDKRQVPYGDFGGGISDDDDLTQQWPPLALIGDQPEKVTQSLDALTDAVFKNNMITNGLGTIKTDELHTYEEGINAISEAMYTSYGDPKAVERLMATGRAYPRIIQKGKDGLTYIISRYYSGTDISTDTPWDWSHAYSPLILHPGILVADFNGNETLRDTVTSLADTYLAKATKRPDGNWTIPEELQSSTGKARGDLRGGTRGNNAMIQIFWAAWRWTGDEKYLMPLRNQLALGATVQFSYINGDAVSALGLSDSLGPKFKAQADSGSRDPNVLYSAWDYSGDTSYLEKIYSDEIATAEQRMWLNTEAHWWSDRVELSSSMLQRTRLGGMALTRNQMVPGHIVSWRFDTPLAAEDVGILVAGQGDKHFKVTAYNLSRAPIHAVMTGWDVAPGQWKVTDSSGKETPFAFERTASTDLTFAPGKTQTYDFTLVTPGDNPASRYDLGIGKEDIKQAIGGLKVTLHSLGAKAAPGAVVILEDETGKEVARAKTPTLAAPTNLLPKTTTVTLRTLAKWKTGMRVRILTPQGTSEITQLNNQVIAQ